MKRFLCLIVIQSPRAYTRFLINFIAAEGSTSLSRYYHHIDPNINLRGHSLQLTIWSAPHVFMQPKLDLNVDLIPDYT